jgi:hypothetical protein
MVGRDVEGALIQPPKHQRYMCWIVAPTYDLGEREFAVIWNDLIVNKALGRQPGVKKAYNKPTGNMYIEFPWKTRIEVRSAAHPETLVGEALDHAIMSEAAKLRPETWGRYIQPSLSDKRGTADFPTTPEGHNWLYELWRLGQNPEFADYASWNFPTWINTAMFPGGRNDPEILLMERTMAREEFLQEVAADFASFTGKVYDEFDEQTHVKRIKFNPLWKNYIAFDFGFSAPLAAIEFQVDPWDRIYIWREHYLANRTLEEHINILKGRDNPPGYHLDLCFGDAEDPEAIIVLNQKFAPCIGLPEAKVNWGEGINMVKNKIRSYPVGEKDEYGTPSYEPWLYVDFDCPNTIKEFNTYRYRESTTTDPVDNNKSGSAIRKNNHAMDAIRYGIVHIFKYGAGTNLTDLILQVPTEAEMNYFGNPQSEDIQTFFPVGVQF